MHSLEQKSPITPTPRRSGYMQWSDGPALGYFALRLWVGVAFTVFGATKIGKGVGGFADAIVKQFEQTFLPAWSVRGYAYALPFAELTVGILVGLGLLTRFGLLLGVFTIISLTFGSALQGKSELVGSQLLYAVTFFLLLIHIRWNAIAVDRLIRPGMLEGLEIGA